MAATTLRAWSTTDNSVAMETTHQSEADDIITLVALMKKPVMIINLTPRGQGLKKGHKVQIHLKVRVQWTLLQGMRSSWEWQMRMQQIRRTMNLVRMTAGRTPQTRRSPLPNLDHWGTAQGKGPFIIVNIYLFVSMLTIIPPPGISTLKCC